MKEQIQKKVRENLDETLASDRAKVLGYEHLSHDVYLNKQGKKLRYNKEKGGFEPVITKEIGDYEEKKIFKPELKDKVRTLYLLKGGSWVKEFEGVGEEFHAKHQKYIKKYGLDRVDVV